MAAARALFAISAWVAFALSSPVAAEEVALTFDDLPTLSLNGDIGYAQPTTTELLTGLKRHRLPAIGFVNESKLEGAEKAQRIALLNQWLDAGMDLGNHSYSHGSLTKTPVRAYVEDVQRGGGGDATASCSLRADAKVVSSSLLRDGADVGNPPDHRNVADRARLPNRGELGAWLAAKYCRHWSEADEKVCNISFIAR